MPTLTLIRGLPGSGKSTLANALWADAHHNIEKTPKLFEADMFFTNKGVYQYDKSKIADAHKWCLDEATRALQNDEDVIVSNTFTQLWEMEPYLKLARDNGYKLNVIECKGQFGNIHNVPEGSLIRFRERWEDFPPQ